MQPKDAEGFTNSVDPDQTARSSLIWVYTVCPDLSVRKLRIFTVSQEDLASFEDYVWLSSCTVNTDKIGKILRHDA